MVESISEETQGENPIDHQFSLGNSPHLHSHHLHLRSSRFILRRFPSLIITCCCEIFLDCECQQLQHVTTAFDPVDEDNALRLSCAMIESLAIGK